MDPKPRLEGRGHNTLTLGNTATRPQNTLANDQADDQADDQATRGLGKSPLPLEEQ